MKLKKKDGIETTVEPGSPDTGEIPLRVGIGSVNT